MNKIVRIGKIKEDKYLRDIFCRIEYKESKLSISGVIGPKSNGDAYGSCGQIIMSFQEYDERGYLSITEILPAQRWTYAMIHSFFDVWDRWHLNDMRPGCEHQRDWDTRKKVELINYGWSMKFFKLMTSVKNGEAYVNEYPQWQKIADAVFSVTTKLNIPKYPTPKIQELLKDGWIKEKGREMKTVGWVYEYEHPEGLLCKPCPVCGYRYGTAWVKEKVPQDVIDFLSTLPDTDKTPAWV